VRHVSLVLHRLLQLVPVLIGMTILVFFMIHLIPGDPARAMLGIRATPAAVASLHHTWGLDKPLPAQYLSFMGRLLRGDLGTSLFYHASVLSLIGSRLDATLLLLLFAAVFSVLITVPLASIAVTYKDRWQDHVVRVVPLVGLGMPSFWIGSILILLLALDAHIFPVGGFGSTFPDHLESMVLPGLTIALAISPLLIRSLRASMLSVSEADYVATARSKGISSRRVLFKHVMRNGLLPTITVFGINIGFIIGGTVVVETVFALPGVGNLMVQSIVNRDFPVVQAATLLFGILVVLVNLGSDLMYSLLDPRVQLR
jgi:peptide/nickel transport system permease protein